MAKVLVVDDHQDVRVLLRTLLERAGHHVVEAADGSAGLRRMFSERPDLVVLDLDMPVLDGLQALARIRAVSGVPVLVCSGSRGDEHLRVLGEGADDYLRKPFDPRELTARVAALLRRAPPTGERQDVEDDGWVRVDRRRHEATLAGHQLSLSPLELRLLGAFVGHRGLALTHDQLLDLAWNGDRGTRQQVKAAVLSLRAKLDRQTEGAGAAIETVRGVGYRWRVATPAAEPSPPVAG